MDYITLANALEEEKVPLKVRFFDGLFIYLVEAIPETKEFIGKYNLCDKSKTKYKVNPKEIKEICE